MEDELPGAVRRPLHPGGDHSVAASASSAEALGLLPLLPSKLLSLRSITSPEHTHHGWTGDSRKLDRHTSALLHR